MNKKLIKQLRKGTIALVNDDTLEELREVLKYAFPKDMTNPQGVLKYYYKRPYHDGWLGIDKTDLPTHSVKEFLTQETETMNTIVNINPDTSENEYPKVMMVSNQPIKTKEDFKYANKRVVFMKKNDRFIAWFDADTIEKSENVTSTAVWNYAVDLDWQPEEEKKPLKLTMEQIAEKFNAERIEIVNYENKYNEYV